MEAPPFSNSEEVDACLIEYLNSLSPLKTKKYVRGATPTLNSLGMDYSLSTPKPEVSSKNVNLIYLHKKTPTYSTHLCHDSSADKMVSTQDYSFELSRQQALQYGSCRPKHEPLISSDDAKYLLGLLGMQEPNGTGGEKDSVEVGTYSPKVGQIEGKIQVPYCDYNNLINTRQSLTQLQQYYTSNSNYAMQTVDSVAYSSIHGTEKNLYEPIAAAYRNQTWDNLANFALMDSNPIERGNYELAQRHFLEFEKTSYTSNISSCTTMSDETTAKNEKPLVPGKNTSDSQRRVLQGNGFSLNAIPASNHYKGIGNEMMFSERSPELLSCTSSLHLSESHLTQVPASIERHMGSSENEVQTTKDFSKSSVHNSGEDICRSKQLDRPNMKRKRKGQIDLVAYCPRHLKEEESADFCQINPKKKMKIKKSDHCKCKKSSCQMKYCECFKGGVGCSPSCKCQGCKNIYGIKDREAETESELEETKALQISRPLLPLPKLSLENPRLLC